MLSISFRQKQIKNNNCEINKEIDLMKELIDR